MRKLFLDDIREPWDDSWDVVRSAKEFKQYIKENGIPNVISYDHDLALEHYSKEMYSQDASDYNKMYDSFNLETGLDCAKWLCQLCVEKGVSIPKSFVHSMNPVGASNISSIIMNYGLFYFEDEVVVPIKPYNIFTPPRV